MTASDRNGPELRPKGRPSVEEAARIDHMILEAALKVLLEQGEAASLNAVAKEAGLSRKSVYARYASREELFVEAVRLTLRDVAPVEFPGAESFEERLGNYIIAALDLLSSTAAMTFHQVVTTHIHAVPDMRDEMIEATRKVFFAPLLDLLAKAQQAGEIGRSDPQLTAQIMFNAMIAHAMAANAYRGSNPPARASNEAYARHMARIATRGLAISSG